MFKNNKFRRFWNCLKKNKPALFGLIIIIFFIAIAICADFIVNYNLAITQDKTARLLFPCKDHIFGTDYLGRDVFARIIHGSRISLTMGLVSTSLSLCIGGFLGIIAGYFGGWIDSIITRIADTLMCIPSILFSLCIIATLGANTINLLIANLVDESIDPYRALARRYLDVSCSVMTPNVKRFETLRNMVEEYQIDAVLEIVLYCCHTYAIESHLVQEFVSNELNLPYLGITTDYSSSDSGQLSTRIGAFLEIIR